MHIPGKPNLFFCLVCLTQTQTGDGSSDTKLSIVYVPTNHVYVGDIFMLEEKDVIHTNLTVRQGLGELSVC